MIRNAAGVEKRATIVAPATPKQMVTAIGGHILLALKRSGTNPAMLVTDVAITWRVDRVTTLRTASRSPLDAEV